VRTVQRHRNEQVQSEQCVRGLMEISWSIRLCFGEKCAAAVKQAGTNRAVCIEGSQIKLVYTLIYYILEMFQVRNVWSCFNWEMCSGIRASRYRSRAEMLKGGKKAWVIGTSNIEETNKGSRQGANRATDSQQEDSNRPALYNGTNVAFASGWF